MQRTDLVPPDKAYWWALQREPDPGSLEWRDVEVAPGRVWMRLTQLDSLDTLLERSPRASRYRIAWRQKERNRKPLGTTMLSQTDNGHHAAVLALPPVAPAPVAPVAQTNGETTARRELANGNDHSDPNWQPVLLFDHLQHTHELRERARDLERKDWADRERIRTEEAARRDREFFVSVVGLMQAQQQQMQQQQATIYSTLIASAKQNTVAATATAGTAAREAATIEEILDQLDDLKERIKTEPQGFQPTELQRLFLVVGSFIKEILHSDLVKERWPAASTVGMAASSAAAAFGGVTPALPPENEDDLGTDPASR